MPTRLIDLRPDRWLLRQLFRLPLPLYRHGLGFLLGGRIVCLIHTGRRSGLPRTVALEVLRHDRAGDAYVVASAGGERADWYRNLMARPAAEIQVGRHTLPVVARRLPRAAAQRELQLYAVHHPVAFAVGFPLVFGSRPRSEADFQALAASIPVLLLSPRDPHSKPAQLRQRPVTARLIHDCFILRRLTPTAGRDRLVVHRSKGGCHGSIDPQFSCAPRCFRRGVAPRLSAPADR